MRLLGTTRKLDIITENAPEDEKYYENSEIKYYLYETEYVSGMRMIFQQAIEREAWLKENEDRFFVNEKRNILSFIGSRGAGKTTAMDEFCRILSKMNITSTRNWWIKHALNSSEQEKIGNEEFKFHILKPIDASLLEEKEDLFELILANIFKEFEGKLRNNVRHGFSEDSKVREVINSFLNILKLYRNIIGSEPDDYDNAYISKLQLKVGSQELQEKVTKLINDLFELEKTNYKHEYIVIAIDDLDLNLKHGYEMLEQIQKYFSYHKIIVLIAVEYEQMQLVCEEHFYREMKYTTPAYSEKKYSEKNRKIANDYMIKIFHFSQRMYMPEMYQITKKAKIRLPKEVCHNNMKDIQVKQFVISKIAEIMWIYYDACGIKSHFSEPETVRSLVAYNEFLESLDVVDFEKLTSAEKLEGDIKLQEGNLEILKKYDQNHERFNNDINVRMVQNILTYQQKKAFEKLNERDLERRAKYFVNAYRKDNEIKFKTIINQKYSYGMLLQKIYQWGKRDNEDYFEDKPFIRCILASFTVEMVREYLKYRYTLEENRDKYKRRLYGFLGDSFGSKWFVEMFPAVYNESLGNEKYGYVEKIWTQNLKIMISLKELEGLRQQHAGEITKRKLKNKIGKWIEQELIIETLECVDMFFIRCEENEFKGMVFDFKDDDNGKKVNITNVDVEINLADFNVDAKKAGHGQYLLITGKGEMFNLDILAFIAKSLNYDKVKSALQNNIIEGLTGFLGKYLHLQDSPAKMQNIKECVEEKVNERSMFSYLDVDFEYEVAFPFYNLDLSYNIFKRVREYYKNKIIQKENLLNTIVEFYDYIGKLLKDEKKVYKELVEFRYYDIFVACPYITAIHKWNNMKESNRISDRLYRAFGNVVVEPPEKAE